MNASGVLEAGGMLALHSRSKEQSIQARASPGIT